MPNVGRLLTIIQEFEFNQNKVVNKVIECKPLGHKPKAILPQDVKVGKVEAKARKDKKAPIKLATPVPVKKVKFEENKSANSVSVTVQVHPLHRHPARHDQAIHFAAVPGSGTTISFNRCNHRLCDEQDQSRYQVQIGCNGAGSHSNITCK